MGLLDTPTAVRPAETPEPHVVTRAHARRLRALVDDNWQRLGRVLRHLGVYEADLDDALQQVFLVADGKLGDIRAGSEKAFLTSTAVHVAARTRRSRGRLGAREIAADADAPDPALGPDEALDRGRALGWLHQILGEMDMDLRAVFVLYEIEEMTMAEIAAVLALPPGTVASRLRRAREALEARAQRLRAPHAARGEAP